jgi:hypothetical protein
VTVVPVRLDAALLRTLLPELVLREGMTLAARVVAREGQRGTLSLAGRMLAAELPETLVAGQEVRLRVADLSAERIVLRLVDPAVSPQAAPVDVPLPRGARLTVRPDPEGRGDGGPGSRSVTVRYESPRLGRVEIRLLLEPGALDALVHAGPGTPAELARAHAGALGDALAGAAGRPARVRVQERRDRVDVHA